MRRPAWLEPVDHTADAGFVVGAATLPQLFERAARGLFALIGDLDTVRGIDEECIAITAQDLPALMVQWLSELNYRHQTLQRVYGRFAVESVTPTSLTARVRGEPIDRARHRLYTEVKAITFHGLQVDQVGRRWRARVIVDL
ncbi:MAG: archease [Lentisphaerae bacterium]|nr:archease [Lentisphaerota bacterium]